MSFKDMSSIADTAPKPEPDKDSKKPAEGPVSGDKAGKPAPAKDSGG